MQKSSVWIPLGTFLFIAALAFDPATALACGDHGEDAAVSEQKKTDKGKVVITVSERGYTPNTIKAKANTELVLAFKRTSDKGCGNEVVFPKHKIRRDLPLNKEVTVKVTPKKDEKIAFTCGMGMLRGSIVAVSQKE